MSNEIKTQYILDENGGLVEIPKDECKPVECPIKYKLKNAFEVLQDGRAKVQSAPVDNDDVVRLLEVSPILSDYVDDALLGG